MQKSNDVSSLMAFLMPVVMARSGALNDDPDLPIVEASEEIRLLLAELVSVIIPRVSETNLEMFADDICTVASKLLLDPFQDVKKVNILFQVYFSKLKEACKIIISMTSKCTHKTAMNYASLTRHILTNVSHKHSSVRVAAIQVT